MNLRRAGVRLFRVAVLALAVWCIRATHDDAAGVPASWEISLAEARALFPAATRLGRYDAELDARVVLDARGAELGLVLRTAPAADALVGYAGPSDLLIGLGLDGRVSGARLRASADTAAHVADVAGEARFWEAFRGWLPADEAPPPVDAVAGSTLTSLAMAEGVELRLAGRARSLRFPAPVELAEARRLIPGAAELARHDDGWIDVLGADGAALGALLRTSPAADNAHGYGGPTEALLAFGPARRAITGVALRRSYDTPEYVERVRGDAGFLAQLAGRTLAEWAEIDFEREGIEGVSGATRTSYGVADGIRRRAEAAVAPPPRAARGRGPLRRNVSLLILVAAGLALGLGPWRRRRRLRLAWQMVLVGGLGLSLGDLLSLALLAGWSRHGVPWDSAPALVLLAAVALVVPWSSHRQVYCANLCPHGAVQEWLSAFRRLRRSPPPGLLRALRAAPWLLLVAAFTLAVLAPRFELAWLEPFDAWVLGLAAAASAAVLAAGLLASLFVPMGYCRYGCPTGALLRYVRTRGSSERLGRRDAAAAALVLGCAPFALAGDAPDSPASTEPRAEARIQGLGFGTTWSVAPRGAMVSPDVEARLRDELARIERELSSWSPASELARFNASETTLPIEVSSELAGLVERALSLSAATRGAFDPTVAPLVDAYGAGPSGARAEPPPAEELARLRERVGWEKLALDRQRGTLRKAHAELAVDLGALLQGYAADRAAALLDAAGVPEYLIEVGGELRARGAWRVAIEDPSGAAAPLRVIELRDAALATSGSYRHPTHLISPRTGTPVEARIRLCAVVAAECVEADGWATALFVAQGEAAELAETRSRAALLVDDAGRVTVTDEAAFGPRTR
ncbi:MAG: FAD:protein FMN transferase [Planctomycetota bacterium]